MPWHLNSSPKCKCFRIIRQKIWIHFLYCVSYQGVLDFLVERSICSQAWRVVHLQEQRFIFAVQNNVESQDLKAQTVLIVIRLARSVHMGQAGLRCNDRLHNDLLDPPPDLLWVFSFLPHVPEGVLDGALVADRIDVVVLVENVVLVLLVDSVVRQVHAHVVDVVRVHRLVLLSRQPCQSIFEDVYSKRIYASDQHVDAQVEFQSLHQTGLVDVLLHHVVLVFLNVI